MKRTTIEANKLPSHNHYRIFLISDILINQVHDLPTICFINPQIKPKM